VTTQTKQKDYSGLLAAALIIFGIAVGVYVNSERRDEKRYQEIKQEHQQNMQKLDDSLNKIEW